MSAATLQLALRAAHNARRLPYVYQEGREVALILVAYDDALHRCLRGNGEALTCRSVGQARDVAARVLLVLAAFPELGAGALRAAVTYAEAAQRFRALRASRVRPRRRWGRA